MPNLPVCVRLWITILAYDGNVLLQIEQDFSRGGASMGRCWRIVLFEYKI